MKNVQFVVNEAGEKTAVQISLHDYEVMLEYLEDKDIAEAARRSVHEPQRPFQEVLEEMRAAGEVDV